MSDAKKAELRARMEEGLKKASETPVEGGRGAASIGFGAVAVEYSDDQVSRYRGGDIGWLDDGNFSYRWPKEVLAAGYALEKGFRLAGGNPARQPSTYNLLGGHFSKDDLSRLFPGKLNQKESDERKQLAMKFLDIITKIPRGHIRTAELGMLREQFPAPSVAGEQDNTGIARFDLKFPMVTPLDKPRELWFDHAIVQETSSTHADLTLKFLETKGNLPADSPAFMKTRNAKVGRYSAIVAVVKRLQEERKLAFQPKFLFPVISLLGIMNGDMIELTKCMSERFKAHIATQPPSSDGVCENSQGSIQSAVEEPDMFCSVVHNQGVSGAVVPP